MATKSKTQVNAAETGQNAVTKISTVVEMLKQNGGATIDEIVKATGWQPHSARAALTSAAQEGPGLGNGKLLLW